jgi:Na+-translocating ferredoxin:NAD+ oxidoreductase subunit G
MHVERILRDGWPLAALAAAIAMLLAAIAAVTEERITENEQQRTRLMLAEMMDLPAELPGPLIGFSPGERLPERFTLCVDGDDPRRGPRRFDFMSDAVSGYGGRIRYLVGMADNERVTGVRIIAHSETPGLGDAIEPQRSDWIRQFVGRRPGDAQPWALTTDGGAFDAIAGATITSRAMVRGLAETADRIEATPRDCDHVVRDQPR